MTVRGMQVTRDALGRIGSATATWQGTTIPLADSLQHRPFGPIARIEFAHGQALAKDWDHLALP